MTYLEIVPVLLACIVWGRLWGGQRVVVYSDNMGVVGCWSRGWARESRTMAVIRHMLFLAATGNFILDVKFVPTQLNSAADALSRGLIDRFRKQCPQAVQAPTPLPEELGAFLWAPEANIHLLTGVKL